VKFRARVGDREFEIEVRAEGGRYVVRSGSVEREVSLEKAGPGLVRALLGERRVDFGWEPREEGGGRVLLEGTPFDVELADAGAALAADALAAAARETRRAAEVRAPIPGLVTRILVEPGQAVRKDQPVLCLDAMKLENEIPAPRDGVLREVAVRAGQPVEKDQILFVVE
jgi:biotin carboxyl carrier protein